MSGWTDEGLAARNAEYNRRLAVEHDARQGKPTEYDTAIKQGLLQQHLAEYPQRHIKEGRIKGVAAPEDRTYNGRQYHSKAEAEYAQQLDFLKKAGAVAAWIHQVSMDIKVNEVPICKVVVDFQVWHSDGTVEYVEIKGFETATWRLKKRLLLACYPGICYTVIRVGSR